MAYIDFNMRPPEATASEPAASNLPRGFRSRRGPRVDTPRASYLIGAVIATILASLLFALAWASIGQPIVAAIVTLLLLLPAASLFGGDDQRR